MKKPKSSKRGKKPLLLRLLDSWASFLAAAAVGMLTVRYVLSYTPLEWTSILVSGLLLVLCLGVFVRFLLVKFREEV
jgi:hypothetical protein